MLVLLFLLISRLINRSGLRISHSKVFSSVSTISNQKFFRLVDYNLVENEKEKKISILHESYFFLTTIREKSASFIYPFLFFFRETPGPWRVDGGVSWRNDLKIPDRGYSRQRRECQHQSKVIWFTISA